MPPLPHGARGAFATPPHAPAPLSPSPHSTHNADAPRWESPLRGKLGCKPDAASPRRSDPRCARCGNDGSPRRPGAAGRFGRGRRVEIAHTLQRSHSRIISRGVMRQHWSAMGSRHVAHASVFLRRLEERHPDADLLVFQPHVVAMRLILVPGRRRAMIVPASKWHAQTTAPSRAKQLPRDLQGVPR